MSNTVSVTETPNSVVVVESDNTVTVTQADNAVVVTAPSNLPFGGATNDLLVKQSATDGDVAWQDEITVDQIGFDTTAAETLTAAGQMTWDADVDTIDVLLRNGTATPTLMHIGQDEYFYVKASSAITRGQVVHYTGTDGASGHILVAPFLANGIYESKTVIGVATQDADTGEFVHVLWRGKLRSFDTSLLTPGILYASTTVAGGFQSTAPTAPDNIVTVAVAVNQKSNGTILVRPTFAGSLAESEDVDVSAPSDGDVLTYSSSTGMWESGYSSNVIAEVLITGPTNSVTLSGIPSDYSILRLYWTLRSDAVGLAQDNLLLAINGNTNNHLRQGFGQYNGSLSGFVQGSNRIIGFVPAADAFSGRMGNGHATFTNPNRTDDRKEFNVSFIDHRNNFASTGWQWSSLLEPFVISSLTIAPQTGDFESGRVILMGER